MGWSSAKRLAKRQAKISALTLRAAPTTQRQLVPSNVELPPTRTSEQPPMTALRSTSCCSPRRPHSRRPRLRCSRIVRRLISDSVSFPPPVRTVRTLLLVRGTTSGQTSNDATFRVTRNAVGTKNIVYWRAGANAHIYSIPLAGSTAVEPKRMRNTVQIGSTPLDVAEKEMKQYAFSVEDAR